MYRFLRLLSSLALLFTLALPATAATTEVIIETNKGDIRIKLMPEKSPITVENFLAYVDSGFYDDTIFHRVIPKFMIQGGGFNNKMQKKPTRDPIQNESDNYVHNDRGTIAMARTNDPHSATAQFYINVKMNTSLDYKYGKHGYTVFGEVVEGMHVVDDIAIAPTKPQLGHQNVPIKPIIIKRAYRVEQDDSST